MILREAVVSSNINAVEYDTESKDLIVEYSSGTKYAYHNVDKEKYDNFLLAESKGKFMNSEVKGKFEYKRL